MVKNSMLSIRIPAELKEAVEDAARAERKSTSEYVASILEKQSNVKKILKGEVRLVLK